MLRAAVRAAQDCDLLLAVGTSLTVHPAAGLVDVAMAAGARVVSSTPSPPRTTRSPTRVVREPIGVSLPRAGRDGGRDGARQRRR